MGESETVSDRDVVNAHCSLAEIYLTDLWSVVCVDYTCVTFVCLLFDFVGINGVCCILSGA